MTRDRVLRSVVVTRDRVLRSVVVTRDRVFDENLKKKKNK